MRSSGFRAGRSVVEGQKAFPSRYRGAKLCVPIVAGPEGFEPPTYRLEGGCSVH
jgi:hypothetical protein